MFQNSLDLVADAGLSVLHVFPFSPRAGTPAARMPQVKREIIKERAARLRQRGDAARIARFQAMIGSTRQVLVEKGNIGHTPCFAPVLVEGEAARGALVDLTLTGARAGQLIGQPVT